MSRTLLLVEDDYATSSKFSSALRARGWTVAEAPNGKAALSLLRSGSHYSAIVLDLRLPDMSGLDMLDSAKNDGLVIPPVYVVSAFVDMEAWRRFVDLRLQGLLPKPLDPEYMAAIIEAFYEGNESALANLPGIISSPLRVYGDALQLYSIEYPDGRGYIYRRLKNSDIEGLKRITTVSLIESLDDKVKRRERALLDHFTKCARQGSKLETDEPILVVARRWNSWYPSYFDIAGGAYAIIGSRATSARTPGVLIDPGFRSVSLLRELGIPVGVLKTCIVTHNHPDHVGDIFRFVASRHVLGEHTSILCSSSTLSLLNPYHGEHVSVRELEESGADAISPYLAADGRRRIVATPVPTSHLDAGAVGGTFGIVLASQVEESPGEFVNRSNLFLLGDTSYDSAEYSPNKAVFKRMREMLELPDLKVMVLHIGCAQLKDGTGKHLYFKGLVSILKDADHARRTIVRSKEKLLVLVSEWGLEHATAEQLREAIPDTEASELIRTFGSENLIQETIEIIENSCNFDRIRLLPADIGLVVGLESGQVYIDGKRVAPENVIVNHDDQGLVYRERIGVHGPP